MYFLGRVGFFLNILRLSGFIFLFSMLSCCVGSVSHDGMESVRSTAEAILLEQELQNYNQYSEKFSTKCKISQEPSAGNCQFATNSQALLSGRVAVLAGRNYLKHCDNKNWQKVEYCQKYLGLIDYHLRKLKETISQIPAQNFVFDYQSYELEDAYGLYFSNYRFVQTEILCNQSLVFTVLINSRPNLVASFSKMLYETNLICYSSERLQLLSSRFNKDVLPDVISQKKMVLPVRSVSVGKIYKRNGQYVFDKYRQAVCFSDLLQIPEHLQVQMFDSVESTHNLFADLSEGEVSVLALYSSSCDLATSKFSRLSEGRLEQVFDLWATALAKQIGLEKLRVGDK